MEKNIHSAIISIMNDLGAICKTKKNQKQGFMYRGVDDVMNALHPLLCKHHVYVIREIIDHKREERKTNNGGNLLYSICQIKYTFVAEDGSTTSTFGIGEGMDSGDKASAKAMSAAFKQACFEMFCIPTEETADPDEDSPECGSPVQQQLQKPEPKDASYYVSIEDARKLLAMLQLKWSGLSQEAVCQRFTEHTGYKKISMIPASKLDEVWRMLIPDNVA